MRSMQCKVNVQATECNTLKIQKNISITIWISHLLQNSNFWARLKFATLEEIFNVKKKIPKIMILDLILEHRASLWNKNLPSF